MLKLTVVRIFAGDGYGKPGVRPWDPAAYEQPGLATAHLVLGVTATDSAYQEQVAVMRKGLLRSCPEQNGETWAEEELLWALADGTVTHTRPDGPLPLVLVGAVYQGAGVGFWHVSVDVRVIPSLGELSGVSVEAPADLDVFIYNGATNVWEPRRLVHNDDLDGLDTAGAHPASAIDYEPSGDLVATTVQDAIDELASVRWEDLRFPAQGINPPGAASDPGVDDDSGLLVFSGTLDNAIAGAAQMPHAWLPGSSVFPHLHLRFPTSAAADTRWKFEYDVADIGGDFTNASGTYTTLATITVANPQNVNEHVVAFFGELDMTGFAESAIILWRISRLAQSDGADDDTNDCLLMEFDVHFEIIKRGTIDQVPET